MKPSLRSTDRNYVFVLFLFFMCAAAVPAAQAQSRPRDTARFDSLKARFNRANTNKEHGAAAELLKQMIGLGFSDSAMYYKLAVITALAGDKAQGKKYFDTALALGWNINADGGQARMLLGIASPEDEAFALHPAASFRRIEKEARAAAKSRPAGYSATLFRLRYEDQNEREPLQSLLLAGSKDNLTSYEKLLASEDAKRRRTIYQMLHHNAIRSPLDLEAAALVLQHGNDTTDFWTAHTLAMRSVALGNEDARWLAAATLDRYLMTKGLPQKYGTQSMVNSETGRMELYKVDPAVTDSERAAWHVPPIQEQRNLNK